MYTKLRKIGLCVLVFSLIMGAGIDALAQKQEITKVFLVRHAEKVKDGTKDPELSFSGKKRSEALSKMLQKIEFTAVYSTNYKRTRDTARPLAEARNLEIELYNPLDSRKFLDGVLSKHEGETIFVVGHSNTIPLLVNTLLGEEKFQTLGEDEYDNIFMVSIVHGTDAEVIQLTFEP